MSETQPRASDSHSITLCIKQLKLKDSTATEEIWHRFYVRLLPLARNRLRGTPEVVRFVALLTVTHPGRT